MIVNYVAILSTISFGMFYHLLQKLYIYYNDIL